MTRKIASDCILRLAGAACTALVISCLALPSNASAQATIQHYEAAATYDDVDVRSLYIPSFDGTRIAVTVHRPVRNGVVADEKLPVIVQQGNAVPSANSASTIRYFTDRGYVWVSQARRGTGASFGVQTGFVNELDARDAKATIEWAGAQPFSSGKVVTFGCSNEAAWQFMVMTLKPRYHVAAAAHCAAATFFDHGISMNGINYMPLADKPFEGECRRREDALRAAPPPSTLPVSEDTDGSLLAAALVQQRCSADFLGQYWLNMPRDGYNVFSQTRPGIADSAISRVDQIKEGGAAILQIGGWFDSGVAGQFETQRLWGGRVFMVPRTHGNRPIGYPNDTLEVNSESLRWFDHFAKGVDNGADHQGVVYYTINAPEGQEWRTTPSWPIETARARPFYLSDGKLSDDRPRAGAEPVIYAQQDVKWFDGYSVTSRRYVGDMSAADAKSIVHTAEPLAQALEVTGAPVAHLWVSADQPDVNVFAVLEDVSPDGQSYYVTDGRLRASWRKLHETPWGQSSWNWHRGFAEDIEPLVPGKPEELVFDFFPTSYVFRPGHRVRISLFTSAGDTFQAPPLAAGNSPTLTLYRDAARPSRIELPVVPDTH